MSTELGAWYEKYGALVHRRCRTLLGNEADANDALQETFMRAHRADRTQVMHPLPWLYATATRICFDALEVRGRSTLPGEGVLQRLKELVGLADASAGSAEDTLSMGAALATLDPVVRDMALLHWLDGLTQEEVAQQTGYSRRTVFTKLKQAEAALRVALGEAMRPVQEEEA